MNKYNLSIKVSARIRIGTHPYETLWQNDQKLLAEMTGNLQFSGHAY